MIEIKRAALYARFSSDNQRTESIDAQIRAMRQFCNQNKWKIVKTYVDEAYSATTDRRPDFQRMIEDSGKGLFDIVLVHKLDRFSRNRYYSAIYKNKLRHNGVRLCSVLERLDDSPESVILEAMIESISEYYSSNIAREVMKGLKENAFNCKHTGGYAPLGYDIGEDKRLVINEHEAEAVRIIYDMYINGFGYHDIADYLNANGYRTKKGKPFGYSSTAYFDILRNEKYTGTYVYNRAASKDYNHKRNNNRNKPDEEIIRIPGGCPAIITKETFQKAVQRRSNRIIGKKTSSKCFYLCSGIVFCGECGRKMTGNIRRNKNTFTTYNCHSRKNECSNYKDIDRTKLEAVTLELLERELFSGSSTDKRVNELNRKIRKYNRELPLHQEELLNQLKEVETEIIKYQSIEDMTIEIYEQLNALNEKQNHIKRQIDNLLEVRYVTNEDYSKLVDKYVSLQDDKIRFRTFIQDYIKRITVYREKVVFCIDYGLGLLDGVTKEFTFARTKFKTPSQRMK
ncbi:MAG: recombinase family protein [Porcipelethomonas sp.]